MNYTKVLFFLSVCLGPCLAKAQTLRIQDLSNLEPIPGVEITHPSWPVPYTTDVNGKVVLPLLEDSARLTIRSISHKTIQITYGELKAKGYTLSMIEEVHALDEVIVSANKFEEKRKDVSQQIQVINARDLQFMNQPTTADQLQQSGTVFVQKSQLGGGSPVLRGFEANKVLLVMDGVRLNNAIYRGGHLQNVITMDGAVLDKTEILFGPGSVIYGSDALGGVLHFYTRNPVLSSDSTMYNKANILTRCASAAFEKTAHLDLNLGWRKIAFLSSLTYSDLDDLKQGNRRSSEFPDFGKRLYYVERINGKDSLVRNSKPNVQKGSAYAAWHFMQKVLFKPNAKVSHLLNLQYSSSTDVPRYDRLTEYNGLNLKYAAWYYGPQKRLFASYTFEHNVKTKAWDRFRLIAAYQNIEESRHDRRFNSANFNHRTEKLNIYSLNLDAFKQVKKQELRYGLEGIWNAQNSRAYRENINTGFQTPLDTRYPDGGTAYTMASAYLSHTFEISPKWILTDGIRYSFIALNSKLEDTTFFKFPYQTIQQNFQSANGSIGLIWMPGKNWRMSVNAATGFRAPNLDDVAKIFESVPGRIIVPNADLKPERTYTADYALSKKMFDKLRIENVIYYTWYTNALTVGNYTYNGQDSINYQGQMSRVTTTLNAKEAYIWGNSTNVYWQLTRGVSIFSTLTYTYGRIKTDSADYPLDHIPPLFGKTGVQLEFNKTRVEIFSLYNGWKRIKDYNLNGEDNEIYATSKGMPGWVTFNVRANYKWHKYFTLQVAVENLLNQNYRLFASGISAPGTNVVVSLKGSL